MLLNGFVSTGNTFPRKRRARLLYLLAGICRSVTNQQLSSQSFVLSIVGGGEEDSRIPTALMAVLMHLMCVLGQAKESVPKQSILNYYQSCAGLRLMASHCHHTQMHCRGLNVLHVQKFHNVLSSGNASVPLTVNSVVRQTLQHTNEHAVLLCWVFYFLFFF